MSEPDTTVIRLFGDPGGGETTVLLDKVEEILGQDGAIIRNILVVSYTRATAAKIRDQPTERLDVGPRSLEGNVSTIHAKAYELLGLSRNNVVGGSDKQELYEDYGVEFEDEYDGAGHRTARSTTIGNKVIAMNQWLRHIRRNVFDQYDVPLQWNIEEVRLPPEVGPNAQEGNKYTSTWLFDDDRIDIPEVIRTWRAYKGERGSVELVDMLEHVKQHALVSNVDHPVINGFQGTMTLQYDVYEEWKSHMRGVLIAGDDDQVVYVWWGVNLNLPLNVERDNGETLSNFYRLPSSVLSVINRGTRHIGKRQEKDLKPYKEDGAVGAVESPSVLEPVRNAHYIAERDEGTVMALFRVRHRMLRLIDEFLLSGIPFSTLTNQRVQADRLTRYVRVVKALNAEEPVNELKARRLTDMPQDSVLGVNDRDDLSDAIGDRQEEVSVGNITNIEFTLKEVESSAPFTPDSSSVSDMTRKATSFQCKSVNVYFGGGYEEMNPSRVRIGTIHPTKGRETDYVFMTADLTEGVVEQMTASVLNEELEARGIKEPTTTTSPILLITGDEHRVLYAGMSRVRERLIVLENLVTGAPTLPISVLLRNEIHEEPTQGLVNDTQELPTPEPEA